MRLTTDELIETGCALLECAFAARQAGMDALKKARDAGDTPQGRALIQQAERHRERATLLLAAIRKIRAAHEEAAPLRVVS